MKNDPRIITLEADEAVAIGAICARLAAVAADKPLPREIVWMPKGSHEISAFMAAGGKWQGTVLCDEAGCQSVAASFARVTAAGHRVRFDEAHEGDAATFWVSAFRWDPTRGIIAEGEWTSLGEELVRGKVYTSFSPEFLVNKTTKRVAAIGGRVAGGLVNEPAFGSAMPAIIARLADAAPTETQYQDHKHTMKELLVKVLAALKVEAPANATEEQLVALCAKHIDRLPEAGAEGVALKAHLAELTTLKAKAAELEALKAKDAEKETELQALKAKDATRRKADAKAAVDAAVARGALPAKDEAIQAKWAAMIESNPDHAQLLASLPDNPALTRVTTPTATGAAVQMRDGVLVALRAMHAEKDHVRRGEIYRDARQFVAEHSAELLPLLAANSLGTLAGDLIVLRSLDLLKLSFPVIGAVTTDFSAEMARQGQVIRTRIITPPAVVALNDTTGWATSDATAADVAITIAQPKGVQIAYGSTELAGTGRNLFQEQVEACHYALAKDLVDALYAVITAANFTNATTKATASVARLDLVAMEKALATRGVAGVLHMLANADIYERMQLDASVVSLATFQKPEVITGSGLPPIAGFNMIRAINLPATGNLTAFGFRKDALAIATRIPEDYTRALPGAAHGNVSVVTNPDTGISVQKVDFVDHNLAKAFSRIAWAYGVAKGNGASGQRLISA